MDVKEAVAKAKAFVAETFADENPINLGLEEVEFDDENNVWNITVGFSRPWQADFATSPAAAALSGLGPLGQLSSALASRKPIRSYKVVSIRNDGFGTFISLRNRAVDDAA